MKRIAVIVMMGFSLAFGECLRNEILVPWSKEHCEYRDDQLGAGEVQYLQTLTRVGVFEELRKNIFPELEVSLEVSNDQSVKLVVNNAKMEDVVVYCGLCRIYAELMRSKEASYIGQLDDANRRLFLKRLKASLYAIYKAEPCLDDETEKFPLIRIVRNKDSHLTYLYVVDRTYTDSSEKTEPYYRLFYVPCISKEQEDELYEVFKEMHPELTRSQYHIIIWMLRPDRTIVMGLTPNGCVYETKLYVQKEIDEQCADGTNLPD